MRQSAKNALKKSTYQVVRFINNHPVVFCLKKNKNISSIKEECVLSHVTFEVQLHSVIKTYVMYRMLYISALRFPCVYFKVDVKGVGVLY